MEFRHIHWQQNQSAAEQYLHSFTQVKELFEYNYKDPNCFKQRAERLDRHPDRRAAREDVVKTLIRYNEKIGNHPNAMESVRRLLEPGALVVIGGQQAGLFTGQLLVIHKAISIIRAAGKAAELLGRPVIPVFWIAGEDHDFDEVNHIYQLSNQLTIDKIELPGAQEQAGKRLTISRRPIDAVHWEEALEQLDASLQQTEFKAEWMETLRSIAAGSDSLSDAFAGIMARLFGEFGLVLLDSDDPELRKAEGPMFRELVLHNEQLERSLIAAKSTMQSLGHEPQAEVKKGGANLFRIRDGERLLLHRSEDGSEFSDKSGSVRFSEEDLLRQTEQSPDHFSNNVFTRPLMQDYLFPVLATVLGPGEIAYWGLTKEAFRVFGMQMPIILPRQEFTLVEGTVKKQMDKLGLTMEDAIFHLEEKREAWLESQDSIGLADQFAEVKKRFEELYAPVLRTVASINPGLRALGETNRQKIAEQIDFFEARAKDAFESQFDAAKRQFERIRLSLTPLGKRQERVYNVFSYLNKYGADWLKQLIDAEYEENGQHIVVYL